MVCPHCQSQVPLNAAACPSCGMDLSNVSTPQAAAPQPTPASPPKLNTWLVPSILVTVRCCLPFGIVAIVFASKANSCLGAQDYEGAQKAAKTAKIWFWVALGTGLVGNIIALGLQVLALAEIPD